jgi:hypothetical protein
MGQNLSSKILVDTFQDVISPEDAKNTRNLVVLWLACMYGFAMIWSTTTLIDRWRGPLRNRSIGFALVIAAIMISITWPVVSVYLMIVTCIPAPQDGAWEC